MAYGLQINYNDGTAKLTADNYPFHLIDSFIVVGDSTGSKSYPSYAGKILYATSHPIHKEGMIPKGNHVTSVVGTTVSWNSIKPFYVTTANIDCTIKVYVR